MLWILQVFTITLFFLFFFKCVAYIVCGPLKYPLDEIRKTTSIFLKMEDELNIFENGRRPHFLKWKTAKNYKKIILPETLNIKTMVVAPLQVT